ncbi:MAG: hypothetical protein AAF612_09925, partial [Planctomycetota bacterium]
APIRSRYLPKGERVSHFGPVRDYLHSLRMHAALAREHPGLRRGLAQWGRHQLLYLPLFVFLLIGVIRSGLAPEPRWHPAFLVGAGLGVAVLALRKPLRLAYPPLPVACLLFLALGAIGVLSHGTPFYPVIHESYGQLREIALHLWVAVVCLTLAAWRPARLLGVSASPGRDARRQAWAVAGVAVAAVFLGIGLRMSGANPAFVGAIPFLLVLTTHGLFQRRARATSPPAPAVQPALRLTP